ncbi:hypodermin-B-like [Melitaea cinxia]|uniref:hypodermin-B-like n=1 Tax=Melitaea cinxia TaxID=113334 RepID=UPI001E2732B4|nr:hypodermin-B-like [Melitaea cinxia]
MSFNYNANPVANIKEIPHHVLIVYDSKFCSGSLIGSKTVVTAASCFLKRKGQQIVVKVGANTMTGNGQVITVIELKIHEYFKHLSNSDNDIALLMLKSHVVFGSNVIKTVNVESDVALRVGAQVIVSGWGSTDLPIKYLNLLLRSEMLVINRRLCKKHYGKLITPSNFCVKYNLEHRLSDNGGGAIFEDMLVGILSSGTSKQSYKYAILTNVSYFHRWITLNTNRFLTKYCRYKNDTPTEESSEYKD